MSSRAVIALVVIVLVLGVVYAVLPSGGDGPSSEPASGNPHAIDQD